MKDPTPKENPKFEVESNLLEQVKCNKVSHHIAVTFLYYIPQERKKHKKELEELTLEVELLRRVSKSVPIIT